MPKLPFYVNSDKTVINAVKQAEWSPKRDLLACLTQDCQLHAYRLTNFQRIWALSFQSEATTLCWQPDGERIAVGHSDGSISVIAAENGDTLLQTKNLENTVACLTWTSIRLRDPKDARLTHDMMTRYRRLCPPIGVDNSPGGEAAVCGPARTPLLSDIDFQVFSILCSADILGNVCLSAFGYYPLLHVSLTKVLKVPIQGIPGPSPKSTPQQLAICPNLSRLTITYGTTADASKPGTLGTVVCSLQCLGSRVKELHSVILIACALKNVMERCNKGMKQMHKQLSASRNTFVKTFAVFECDTDGSSELWAACKDTLHQKLQELLTRGVAAPSMQIFLTNRPGEHGLKQAARSIDSALNSGHTEIATVVDSLQRVAFLLGELQGLLASAPEFVGLGVELDMVVLSGAEAAAFLLRMQVLRIMVTDVASLHRVFFQWLLGCVRAHDSAAANAATPPLPTTPQQMHSVTTFLNNHFLVDALGAQIQAGNQQDGMIFQLNRSPVVPRNNLDVTQLMALCLGTPVIKPVLPLADAFAKLQTDVTDMFAGLPTELSPSVLPVLKVAISGRSKGYVPCSVPALHMPMQTLDDAADTVLNSPVSQPSMTQHLYLTFACAMHQKRPDSVTVVRIEYTPDDPTIHRVCGCILEVVDPGSESRQSVVDARCYRSGSLVILTKTEVLDTETAGPLKVKSKGKEQHVGHLILVADPFPEESFVLLENSVQLDCPQAIANLGGIVKLSDLTDVKVRHTPSGLVNSPLGVSVSRGLAAVCAMQRITVYDLEDEDNDELDDDSEDEAVEVEED